MVKFGKKLKEHVANQKEVPSDCYVDYKGLKSAIKSGCSEDVFQELYNAELERFVVNLDRGMAADPRYVELNRLALDNICKKFDKRNRREAGQQAESLRKRNRARVPLAGETHTESGERLHGWVYDPELAARVFKELDTDGDGKITSTSELQAGLKRLNLGATTAMVDSIMEIADQDNDGVITLEDFQRFVYKRESEIKQVFQSLDRDEDGLLTHADLILMMERLELPATDEELDQMVQTMMERANLTTPGSPNPLKRRYSKPRLDEQGRLMLDYSDFRELMLLVPQTANARSVFHYWIKAADVDFDFQLPAERTGKDKDTGPLRILFAGAIAGTISRSCTAPMDRVKVMMQVDSTGKYNGILDAVRKIYAEGAALPGREQYAIQEWRRRLGGCMTFYRGNGTNCIKIAPESAIKFYAYEAFKGFICQNPDNVRVHERFAAGGLAGMVAQAGIYPMEICKTRLAVAPRGMYKGISHCLFRIARKEGMGAWYKGLGASLCGIVPYASVDLGVYFSLKEYLASKEGASDPGVGTLLACGTLSSTCGMLVSYPLQLVRTRLQATGLKGMPNYTGIWDCVSRTVKNDGPIGLYRGLAPNMCKAIPAISISYAVYETVKKNVR